jgi:hypothetical protein
MIHGRDDGKHYAHLELLESPGALAISFGYRRSGRTDTERRTGKASQNRTPERATSPALLRVRRHAARHRHRARASSNGNSSSSKKHYADATIERFQRNIRGAFLSGDSAMAKRYLRFLFERTTINEREVTIEAKADAALTLMAVGSEKPVTTRSRSPPAKSSYRRTRLGTPICIWK